MTRTKGSNLSKAEKHRRCKEAIALMAGGKNSREAAPEVGLSWQDIVHSNEYKAWKKRKETAPQESHTELTLDMIEQVIIDRFEQAARVPGLEEEVLRLKNIKAALENTNELLKRKVDEQDTRKKQLHLAQQQGDRKLPLASR